MPSLKIIGGKIKRVSRAFLIKTGFVERRGVRRQRTDAPMMPISEINRYCSDKVIMSHLGRLAKKRNPTLSTAKCSIIVARMIREDYNGDRCLYHQRRERGVGD